MSIVGKHSTHLRLATYRSNWERFVNNFKEEWTTNPVFSEPRTFYVILLWPISVKIIHLSLIGLREFAFIDAIQVRYGKKTGRISFDMNIRSWWQRLITEGTYRNKKIRPRTCDYRRFIHSITETTVLQSENENEIFVWKEVSIFNSIAPHWHWLQSQE